MAKFRQGGAPRIIVETIDPNNPQNGPQDVTSIAITIIDASGNTIVNAQAMTRLSQGIYSYQFQLSSSAKIGQWTRFCTITDTGGFVNIEEPEPAFEVTA